MRKGINNKTLLGKYLWAVLCYVGLCCVALVGWLFYNGDQWANGPFTTTSALNGRGRGQYLEVFIRLQ